MKYSTNTLIFELFRKVAAIIACLSILVLPFGSLAQEQKSDNNVVISAIESTEPSQQDAVPHNEVSQIPEDAIGSEFESANATSAPEVLPEIVEPSAPLIPSVTDSSSSSMDSLQQSEPVTSTNTLNQDLGNVLESSSTPVVEELEAATSTNLQIDTDGAFIQLPRIFGNPFLAGYSSTSNLSLKPIAATMATASVDSQNLIVYSNVYDNTDFKYSIQHDSLKEYIVLNNDAHPDRFSFDTNFDSYSPIVNSDGSVSIFKKGHARDPLFLKYVIPAPFMTDASGASTTDISVTLDGNILTVQPSADWLKSAAYPVVIDPTVQLSVLNIHSHPVAGENWTVDFVTEGSADLRITPADQATIDDMEFSNLMCGSEDRTSGVQILEGDVLYYPNWNCDDLGTVIHRDLKTGNHHLQFSFSEAVEDAYNSTITWTGAGSDSRWENGNNWSGGVVPGANDLAVFDATCASNCSAVMSTSTSLMGISIASGYTATVTIRSLLLQIGSNGFTQSGGVVVVGANYNSLISNFGSNTEMVVRGNFRQLGGTLYAPRVLRVSGNFVHSGGTFYHNSLITDPGNVNSVVLDGVNQQVIGSTTFYHLVKTATTTDTLVFASSSTQTILGTLELRGNASTSLLTLRSDAAGVQWNVNAAGNILLDHLAVKDSHNVSSTSLSVANQDITDGGNNTGWVFSDEASSKASENLWVTDGPVKATGVLGNTLYVGGQFTYVGPNNGAAVPFTISTKSQVSGFPKIKAGMVRTIISDGSGGWFVGGLFSQIGNFRANGLAHILSNGSVDTAFNAPFMYYEVVDELILDGSTLYVRGRFQFDQGGYSHYGFTALNATTGSRTSFVFSDTSLYGYTPVDMVMSGTTLYISFAPGNTLAAINTTNGNTIWSKTIGGYPFDVNAMVVSGSVLYIGGDFDSIGGTARTNFAALNAATGQLYPWNPGADGVVYSMLVVGSTLYVGGNTYSFGSMTGNIGGSMLTSFSLASTTNPTYIPTWHPDGMGNVYSLLTDNTYLYTIGQIGTLGGEQRHHVARFDLATGSLDPWQIPAQDEMYAAAISGSTIYLGGGGNSVGGKTRNSLAAIDTTTGQANDTWNPSADLTGSVNIKTLAVDGSTVYVGGNFSYITLGGQQRNYLAAFDATTGLATAWDPEPDSRVETILVNGNYVYVGGNFCYIGNTALSFICYLARVDKTTGINDDTWDPEPGYTSWASIYSLAMSNDNTALYVGGEFSEIGDGSGSLRPGAYRNNVAAISTVTGLPTSWDPGVDSSVNALAVAGNTVYMGGSFTTVGGVSQAALAGVSAASGSLTVTPTLLHDSGLGYSPFVQTLLSDATNVYIGGQFTSVNGVGRLNAAALNATSSAVTSWNPGFGHTDWTLLTGGSNRIVNTISKSSSTLYVGGDYSTTGGDIEFNSTLGGDNNFYLSSFALANATSAPASAVPVIAFATSTQTVSVGATSTAVSIVLNVTGTSTANGLLTITGGTAVYGVDFTMATGTYSVITGSLSTTVPVTLLATPTATSTIQLTLSNPTNATLGTTTTHTITIPGVPVVVTTSTPPSGSGNSGGGGIIVTPIATTTPTTTPIIIPVTVPPSVQVIPSSTPITTTSSTTYTIVLVTPPTEPVEVIPVPPPGVTVTPPSVIFTPTNWQTPQVLGVTLESTTTFATSTLVIPHTITTVDPTYANVLVPSVEFPVGTAVAETQVVPLSHPVSGSTLEVDLRFVLENDPKGGVDEFVSDDPYRNVGLGALVYGSATGPINYYFDCNNDGTYEAVLPHQSRTFYYVPMLCDFVVNGVYTASVKVERGGLTAFDTAQFIVGKVVDVPKNSVVKTTPVPQHLVVNSVSEQHEVPVPLRSPLWLLIPSVVFIGLKYAEMLMELIRSIQSVRDAWYVVVRVFHQLLVLFGLRRRRRYWGTVYDSHNKQPLDPAVVELLDARTGMVVDSCITDMAGRYGFLVQPGTFRLRVTKTHYEFPSKHIVGTSDEFYDHLYHGEALVIAPDSSVIAPNIPMDALAVDWNQEEKSRLYKQHPRLAYWFGNVIFALVVLSTALAFYNVLKNPSLWNLAILAINILLFAMSVYAPLPRLWGRVYALASGEGLRGIKLELRHAEISTVVIGRAITANRGKYFLRAEQGNYLVTAYTDPEGVRNEIATREVEVKNEGMVNKDIVI